VARRVAAVPTRVDVGLVSVERHLPAADAYDVIKRLDQSFGAPQRLPVRLLLRKRRTLHHPPSFTRRPGPSVEKANAAKVCSVVEQRAAGAVRGRGELLLELPQKPLYFLSAQCSAHHGVSPCQERRAKVVVIVRREVLSHCPWRFR